MSTPHDASDRGEVLRFLGLPFDLDGFYAWAEDDETLRPLATALAGYRPPLQPNPFEALVTSITAQQVSLQSAAAIRSRFVERYGVPREHARSLSPSASASRARPRTSSSASASRPQGGYVVGLLAATSTCDELAALSDEEVTARLVALRGLGQWTADWFLARHLARPHAWPAGDLGLRKAVAAFYGDVSDFEPSGPLPPVREPERPLPSHRPSRSPAPMTSATAQTPTSTPSGALGALAVRELRRRRLAGYELGCQSGRVRTRARCERSLPCGRQRRGSRLRLLLARGACCAASATSSSPSAAPRGIGPRAYRGRDREPAGPGRDAPDPEREPGGTAVLREAGIPRGVPQPRPALEVRTVGSGRSFGSIHLQTDDIGTIERAVRQFVPRLPAARTAGSSRRRGTAGSPSTTTSATATRRCCAGWRASSRNEPAP